MWFLYYDVGKCPLCGSEKTGRIFKAGFGTGEIPKITADAFRQGEYRKYKLYEDGMTTFCADCGVEWAGTYKTVFMSPKKRLSLIKKMMPYHEIADEIEISGYSEVVQDDKKKNHIIGGMLKALSPVSAFKYLVWSIKDDLPDVNLNILKDEGGDTYDTYDFNEPEETGKDASRGKSGKIIFGPDITEHF